MVFTILQVQDGAESPEGRGYIVCWSGPPGDFSQRRGHDKKGDGLEENSMEIGYLWSCFFVFFQNSSVFLIFLIIYERSHVFTCFFCLRCVWSLLTT